MNKNKTHHLFIACATLFLSGLIMPVQGTVNIVQNFTLDSIDTILGPTDTDTLVSGLELARFSVDQFDPTLGTLESFSFSLEVSFTAFVTGADNPFGSGADINFNGSMRADGNLVSSDGGGTGIAAGPSEMASSVFNFDLASTELPDGFEDTIIGAGEFDLLFGGTADFINQAGSVDMSADFDGGTLSWTYTYTPVPEPSHYTLFLGAASVLLLVRRRKRTLPSVK